MAAEFPEGWRVTDPFDAFEKHAGPFLSPETGEPRYAFRVEARHCNSGGTVHGGLLMTFADLVMCVTATRDTPDERALTVSLTASFVDAGALGDLVEARGEVIRRTGSLVFGRGEVLVGERVLLSYTGVVKRVRRG